MADSITFSTSEGGNGILNSIVGVLVGVVFFFGSFVLLWWNEGNVIEEKAALDEIRSALVKTDANKPKPAHNGKLVHATAKLASTDRIGDAPYLKPGPYLGLQRVVEMYQWIETAEEKRVGKRTETTYKYALGWAEGRQASEKFKVSAGHDNPPLAVQPRPPMRVAKSTFGKLDGNGVILHLRPSDDLALSPAMIAMKGKVEIKGDDLYLRKKPGSTTDALGDVRVSYRVLKPGTFSVIAKLAGKGFVKHKTSGGREKFIVEAGAKSPDTMITHEKEAANSLAMVLRFVGAFVMFVGMNLMAGPLTMILSFIPIIGTLGRFMLGVVFFVASAVLSTVTILVSMIAHSPILLALVVLGAAGGAFYYMKNKRSGGGSGGRSSGSRGGGRGSQSQNVGSDSSDAMAA